MFSQKYQPLQQKSPTHSIDQNSQNDADDDFSRLDKNNSSIRQLWKLVYALCLLLGISIATNAFLLLPFARPHVRVSHQGAPSIAGLEWNVPSTMVDEDAPAMDDPMWDAPEFSWSGYVALKHSFAKANGVKHSQNWPWDYSKGIYILHAHHSIHCINVIREALLQFRDGDEQFWPFGHLTHCMHLLRDDVTCMADDTPLSTGSIQVFENKTTFLPPGSGQTRMCRDWNKIHEFATQNSACYHRPRGHYIPILDRFKYCPDGSQPWIGKEGG